jgi:hypothetical protein
MRQLMIRRPYLRNGTRRSKVEAVFLMFSSLGPDTAIPGCVRSTARWAGRLQTMG